MLSLSTYTHETAPTEFIEAEGVRYAYRRFGKQSGVPILFLSYLSSNMDGWDPIVTNGLANDNEIILFDNGGVGASGGKLSNDSSRHGEELCRVLPSARPIKGRCSRLLPGRDGCAALGV